MKQGWIELEADTRWTNGSYVIERVPSPTGATFPVSVYGETFARYIGTDFEDASRWVEGRNRGARVIFDMDPQDQIDDAGLSTVMAQTEPDGGGPGCWPSMNELFRGRA